MTFPDGWTATNLGAVAQWGSGGTPKAGDSRYYEGNIPWAVIGDLNDSIVTDTASSITDAGLAASSAKIVPTGAVLVAMYGSIGKLGLTARPMATNQAIAFAIPRASVEVKFLFYYLMSQRNLLLAVGKGATQRNIGQGILKKWPIVVPALTEQWRIVEILEDHLSRLDAANSLVEAVDRRLSPLVTSILLKTIPTAPPAHWTIVPTGAAGHIDLGRQRHPDWHTGPEMRPYLRVANVFEDRIDASDVKEMDFSGVFERYRLKSGDVLLNEGQSPEYLGRPAIYRNTPEEVAFTNTLLRFRAGPGVMPEWALLVFRRHMRSGRFVRESRITTNIAHLSSKRLKAVEFPIPPIGEQEQLVARASELFSAVEASRASAEQTRLRSLGLRRALLAAAFSGRLTGRRTDVEVVEEMARV